MHTMTAKAVVFDRVGGADVLDLRTVDVPPPGPGEIRLRIKAIGLNRSEAMFREGWHPVQPVFPSRIGYEVVGIVESVGEGVTGYAAGDRVCTLPIMELNAYGGYGEVMNAPAMYCTAAPSELTDEEAAALYSSYMTAYGMLIELVDIRAGDWVIVTAASSSLGPPVIQILKMLGARVIATTRTRAKADAVLAMGADHVIVTGEEDLKARVMEITGGAGARFAFDPVAGPFVETIASAMAPRGTIVIYGVLDFATAPIPIMNLVGNNLSIVGYAMYLTEQPERDERAVSFIRKGVTERKLKPLVGQTFSLYDVRKAATYFDSMQQIGKVVVVP